MSKEFINRLISSLVITPIVIYIIFLGSFYFVSFIYICFVISINEWLKIAKTKKYLVPGFIFLMLSFISAYEIRYTSYYGYNGDVIFLFILATCIMTDLGGYFFGKILKGPKLTSISPKKTITGFVGGFLLPIFFFHIFYKFNHLIFINFNINIELYLIYMFIISLSLISQLGDLTISYFKRKTGIKNTGNLIPGHGGILDRIDGMIFVFFISCILFFL